MYTFRFRSVPYPMLQNFDAPNGEISCARRSRSNTPLQALTMLNEPLFLECARGLAEKILSEGGPTESQRIAYAVRSCLSRNPNGEEVAILRDFLVRQLARFQSSGADPLQLLTDKDSDKAALAATIPEGATPVELAAWTALCRLILSLDETITRE
jgi:hypothetical protein